MKKIFFLAPERKGGPYFIYKEIYTFLKEKYSNEFEVNFVNSKKDYLKLQFGLFGKIDILISVIPFLFRPIFIGKIFFNPRGNFDLEKKKNGLGNKLLYFAENNLDFADKIILTSYFLADKLNFRKKYEKKIEIISNFLDLKGKEIEVKKIKNDSEVKILTVSSTKFLEKGMGIVDLGSQLSEIKEKNIIWTIIAGGNLKNKKIIKKEFNKIKFQKNIKINWIDWVEKEELNYYYKNSDIFLYGTRLETFGITILEAMSFGLPVILYEYELWEYIFPEKISTKNIGEKLEDVLDNYEEYSKLSIDFVKKFEKEKILEKIIKIINE